MNKVIVVLTAVLLGMGQVKAEEYPNGYVSDGYTYRDGYWWKGGSAYKWEKYWVDGYYYHVGGCQYYSPGKWSYRYSAVPVAYLTPPAPPVSPNDPDWRSKLLDIAGARDKAEANARKNAWEQRYFLEAVSSLGLQGNFRWDGYGASPFPAGTSGYGYSGGYGTGYGATPFSGIYSQGTTFQLGTHGVQGQTAYGYTYKGLVDLYGDTNLNTLYQQANRLAENAQRLGGQANTEFGALVQQEGANKARVAEILARAEAVRGFMQSLDGPPKTVTESRSLDFRSGTGGMQGVEVPPGAAALPPGNKRVEFEAAFKQDCASCHSGNTPKGGFDLKAYYAMGEPQKLKVWQLLVTPDKDKMMPRARDGGPGEYLPRTRVKLWTEN